MKIKNKQLFKVVAVAQILVLFVLAGCSVQLPVNICHATGDLENPYEVIAVTTNADVEEHIAHANDLYPVPEGGCPTTLVEVDNEKITICHATSSESNPYNEITVSVNGLNGHAQHEGDILPAPVGGCPESPLEVVEGEISICHVTGIEGTPYEEVMVDVNGLDGHVDHVGDIVPAPVGGCPTVLLVVNEGKVSICHATSSEKNPYNEINISVNGLNGHSQHEGDIFPVPVGGCPTSPLEVVEGQIAICHVTGIEGTPYEAVMVDVNGLDGHVDHVGDIFPAPVGGCPTILLEIEDGKVSICHATSSEKNPYNEINVSVNGFNGHARHEGDTFPAFDGGCPDTPLDIVDNKITICHATGSEKNPYVRITVSVNGLNGHGKHERDVIPATAGSCPNSK